MKSRMRNRTVCGEVVRLSSTTVLVMQGACLFGAGLRNTAEQAES